MKLLALARVSACSLLLALCPALLGHCGGSATEPGTETGNPPRVDGQKLRLTLREVGAELLGEPGAVSPGAQVRLENRSTGAVAEVTAGADGGFSVIVAGTGLDTYELTVTHQGGTVSLQVSVDVVPTSDPGTLSCEQLGDVVEGTVRQSLEGFAAGCTSDSECVSQSWQGTGCQVECGETFVLAAQREAAVTAAEQASAALCTERQSRCVIEPPRCPPSSALAECHQGSCRALSVAVFTCDGISQRASQRASDEMLAADHSCNVDADCTLFRFSEVRCVATCAGLQDAVSNSAVAGLQEKLTAIDETICGTFSGNACPGPIQLPCAPMPGQLTAVCSNNRCETEYIVELP